MSAEATLVDGAIGEIQLTATAAHAAGEVIQIPDGRAAIVGALSAVAIGDKFLAYTQGRFSVAKTASVVILDGAKVYWDRSASKASYKADVAQGDFYLGTAVGDAASADTEMTVDINAEQQNLIEFGKGGWDTVAVKTAGTVIPNPAAGLCGQEPGGITTRFSFSATSEAQKVDALSRQSIPVTLPFIVEGRCAVYDIADAAAVDINIGIANGTHATDADSITESLFLHFDGNALDILAESDDGTTEVAATDTTVNAVDDTFFDFAIDMRDNTDPQVYINGVLVLSATVFAVNAATGPWKLLFHMEKTANDTTAEFRIEKFSARVVDVERFCYGPSHGPGVPLRRASGTRSRCGM